MLSPNALKQAWRISPADVASAETGEPHKVAIGRYPFALFHRSIVPIFHGMLLTKTQSAGARIRPTPWCQKPWFPHSGADARELIILDWLTEYID